MDKNEAFRQIENLGHGYFYDFVDQQTDEEILTLISEDIQNTQMAGIIYWEQPCEALEFLLTVSSDKELDRVLEQFGHTPEEVGGSRQFFRQVYKVITGAIEKRKST